ncbi:DsbA family oxidoreductase [Aeromicrobium panaciterrae]|uniref:DsbA family oxidoreductase n=1 Tax=Aeromicrobium panaciterrae TaxID=363861 RepID=UPI0031E3D891
MKVDIWSDVACPWCFIGKRRFEAAAAEFSSGGNSVEVEYHSFELSPDTPVDYAGTHSDFLSTHKGIPEAQASRMLAQMTELGKTVDIAYDYDALHTTNTIKAHQLLHLAKSHGLQVEMKERLLKAYFEEGRHVGETDELADLGADVGLDRDEVVKALESDQFLDDVLADKAQAVAYGINGVPFFVINGKYGVSGAQESAVFVDVLTQAAAE